MTNVVRRFLPVLVLAVLFALVFVTGLHRYVSLEMLSDHYLVLREWAAARPVAAPLIFGLIYALAVAISVPGAVILTIAAGLMFGMIVGTVVAVVAATIGATTVFLVAQTAFGDVLRRRAHGWIAAMERGFQDDAVSYLLVLRLMPVFPFWLVNLVPAILGVRLRSFVFATAIGIVPGSAVYVSVGNGLGSLLMAGGVPDLGIIFAPSVLGPLVGLAALALVPVVYKRVRAARLASATTATDAERLRTTISSDSER
ncbi:MAG: VTT domain-containing protein [Pseudomonadota bacterium]